MAMCFTTRLREINDIKTIASAVPWLIENMVVVRNDERFTRKSFIGSAIGRHSGNQISINTLLSLWDYEKWIEIDSSGSIWFVYRLYDRFFMMFDKDGHIRKMEGSRKYVIQYIKHPCKVPYEWGDVNINQLKNLYDSCTGLFGL